MDPNPTTFPIFSYVMSKLPSIGPKHVEFDIEQPLPSSAVAIRRLREEREESDGEVAAMSDQANGAEEQSLIDEEEAMVALIEHRTKEVQHLRKKVSYYQSQQSFALTVGGLYWEGNKERPPEPLDFFIWTVERRVRPSTVSLNNSNNRLSLTMGFLAKSDDGLDQRWGPTSPVVSVQIFQWNPATGSDVGNPDLTPNASFFGGGVLVIAP
ncbi:hypothetical protein Vadar_032612 [Vaccinium darrowii]|uniref:Uncharacterized protein n=1 Tax=Vaccinium darrowii TaxID=229202 RepID=A0ACB7YBH3_9ERIC|nr:hypothetical protein Vadar_032612 [Vaccinium darrowii]